jgi:hypothetical protein
MSVSSTRKWWFRAENGITEEWLFEQGPNCKRLLRRTRQFEAFLQGHGQGRAGVLDRL